MHRLSTLILLLTINLVVAEHHLVEKRDASDEIIQIRSKRCSEFKCEGETNMTNSLRHLFLRSHNDMRESIAKGIEAGKNGLLPKAANMYKLRWSCDLEKQASTWTQQCEELDADHILGQGQNSVIIKNPAADLTTAILAQLTAWRNQILTADIEDDLQYNIRLDIQEWTNMANAATTEVGCAVTQCSSGLSLTCFYNKEGDIPDHAVYVPGAPCIFDYECTTHEGSHCVPIEGLCYLHAKKERNSDDYNSLDTSENICPRNAKLSDTARQTILDWHNAFRSNLANGKEEDGEGGYAPMARNMLKMHYDCVLERSAQEAVDRCRYTPYKMGKTGENLFVTENENTRHDQISLLQQAAKQWWDELRLGGVGYNNTFSRKDITHHVDSFTQMAWSRTYRVGCATKACGGRYFAVCHYAPSGNKHGHRIYEYGSPCSSDDNCDIGQRCAKEEGLCVVILA